MPAMYKKQKATTVVLPIKKFFFLTDEFQGILHQEVACLERHQGIAPLEQCVKFFTQMQGNHAVKAPENHAKWHAAFIEPFCDALAMGFEMLVNVPCFIDLSA